MPQNNIDFTKASLGIELGSTRIKSVLIDENCLPIASGSFLWENKLQNGFWTYSLDDVWNGIQQSYGELKQQVLTLYGATLTNISSIGVSAMMHGYLPFDSGDNLLVPFRTWRNTSAQKAADLLSKQFSFNIPCRWSIAHLYEAILENEDHIDKINFITTLAGYVHWKLTGKKVLGVGDASGMFPIESTINNYDPKIISSFDDMISHHNFSWNLSTILPKVLYAGENAGYLTDQGAKLLDIDGDLSSGIPLCPPEGDAGTGMVATNSTSKFTGNVSAGTSIFAMIVLDKQLSKSYPEIDMVTTPSGNPVAMVHCNNCSSDLDAWVNLMEEVSGIFGARPDKTTLYNTLYQKALFGDEDCGGILTYNYFSGEPITGLDEGRPLLVRTPNSKFNLANLMRSLIFSAISTLKMGMNILSDQENINVQRLIGHGGLFKTPEVGQRLMAAALDVPVTIMESAGEGGAWGISLLASYLTHKSEFKSLEDFLENKVFTQIDQTTLPPDEKDRNSFNIFMDRYIKGLDIEKTAVKTFD